MIIYISPIYFYAGVFSIVIGRVGIHYAVGPREGGYDPLPRQSPKPGGRNNFRRVGWGKTKKENEKSTA